MKYRAFHVSGQRGKKAGNVTNIHGDQLIKSYNTDPKIFFSILNIYQTVSKTVFTHSRKAVGHVNEFYQNSI
jgi:hypothetical protein